MALSEGEKNYLLKIARQTLEHRFSADEKFEPKNPPTNKNLLTKKATFVTLHKNGQLRGCIGSLLPKHPLYKDVINNTLNAAFADLRFPPLERNELPEIQIEISVLSKPKRIIYDNPEDLLSKIKPGEYGLILQSNFHQATFLPQVWQDLSKKEDFLTNLALKAGLSPNAWKDPGVEFFYYTVESFSE